MKSFLRFAAAAVVAAIPAINAQETCVTFRTGSNPSLASVPTYTMTTFTRWATSTDTSTDLSFSTTTPDTTTSTTVTTTTIPSTVRVYGTALTTKITSVILYTTTTTTTPPVSTFYNTTWATATSTPPPVTSTSTSYIDTVAYVTSTKTVFVNSTTTAPASTLVSTVTPDVSIHFELSFVRFSNPRRSSPALSRKF